MKTNLEICKLITSIFIVVIPLQIVAQENRASAAWIDNIAEISNGNVGVTTNETSHAQLKRSNENNWQYVKKKDELYFNDILKLDKDICLRISIKNNIQKASVTMFKYKLKEPGKYQFTEDPLGSGNIGIDIKQGSAIIQVYKNKINMIIEGLKTAAQSGSTTCALYNVQSDGSGEIYLQQGHLLFPGNSTVPGLLTGQVAQFQNGQITNVFFPDIAIATDYNNLIKYNNSTVWKKPFFKRPGTWIGAAVIGIGTALIITKPWVAGDKKVNGTISVHWGSI